MQYAKIIFFHEKKVDVRKGFFLLFYQIVMKCFFMQEFKCRIFMNPNSADFVMKTLYLAFKFVLNEKQFSWLTLLLVHSYFFLLLFTFLDETRWDVCFIVTLALLEWKASYTLMFCDAISLKPVGGTYMGRSTPVCNRKTVLGVHLGLSKNKSLTWSMRHYVT